MKKLLVAFMALAVAATVSMAGVRIDWQTGWGAYDHTAGPNPTGGNYLLDSASVVWQLIYAGVDNQIDRIDDPANPIQDVGEWQANNYLLPASQGGDDVLWGQRIISQGGGAATGGTVNDDPTTWSNDMWLSGGLSQCDFNWTTAGFVYQRVFEGTPSFGSWYYESGLVSVPQWPGSPAAETEAWLDSSDNLVQPNNQFPPPVPEPATMGLLGLGALVMAIRRRRS